MAEAAAYLVTLALFALVIVASARMKHEMLLLGCIPPVFVAAIMGFVMAIYAGDTFGWVPVLAVMTIGGSAGWWAARRFNTRDLLIVIYLVWAVALVTALISFGFPDRDHP